MGDVYSTVDLLGLDAEGRPQRTVTTRALVDTGASVSVVSKALALACGALELPAVAMLEGKMRRGAMLAMRPAEPRCSYVALAVVVDDALLERAHLAMILGHDYLQKQRVAIYMHEEEGKRGIVGGVSRRKPRASRAAARRR
jgi:hypothetical protein